VIAVSQIPNRYIYPHNENKIADKANTFVVIIYSALSLSFSIARTFGLTLRYAKLPPIGIIYKVKTNEALYFATETLKILKPDSP